MQLKVVESTPPLAALGLSHSLVETTGKVVFVGSLADAEYAQSKLALMDGPPANPLEEMRKAYYKEVQKIARQAYEYTQESGQTGSDSGDWMRERIEDLVAKSSYTNEDLALTCHFSNNKCEAESKANDGDTSWSSWAEACMREDVYDEIDIMGVSRAYPVEEEEEESEEDDE